MPDLQEIERDVEQEAIEIKGRLKDIEKTALEAFTAFNVQVEPKKKAELTAKRLVNASVSASQMGDNIKAIAALRVAVTVDDNCWEAYYNLGWQYLTLGKKLHDPFMGKVSVMSGDSFNHALTARLEMYERAISYLQRTIQLKPDHSKGWCLLGQTRYYMAQYHEAKDAYEKAIALDPTGEGGRMAAESLRIMNDTTKR